MTQKGTQYEEIKNLDDCWNCRHSLAPIGFCRSLTYHILCRRTYSIDNDNFIDANNESYNIVNESLGDSSFSKIYVTNNYICLSEEGNNYQYIYSKDFKPDAAHYAPQDDDKIHKLGNDWYLITPN